MSRPVTTGGHLGAVPPRWVFLVTYKILIIFTASTAASDNMNFGEHFMLRSGKANMFHYRLSNFQVN